jgi:cell division protein FtsI/penicillin-binding protein 2
MIGSNRDKSILQGTSGWRSIQPEAKRRRSKRSFLGTIFLLTVLPMLWILIGHRITGGDSNSPAGGSPSKVDPPAPTLQPVAKSDVQKMLNGVRFADLDRKYIDVEYLGQPYRVETSLDLSLQQYLQKSLDTLNSRYIGIVALDPDTGRVLSMIGYNKKDSSNNPCLDNRYPAASIFKIITAAAAIETLGLGADSELTYSGNKHTLYKSQLKDRKGRGTRKITLKDSFAQSVNPVFGKIGARQLGKPLLEKYADAFGFNRSIDFELPLTPSQVSVSDEPFQCAEIASGFNRGTTLSPVHGALIAGIVLNQGRLIEPTIVEKVTDRNGGTIYRGHSEALNQAVTPAASDVIYEIMRATIRSGTSRKAFRGYQKDRILSKLIMGGKTGSINNEAQDARFDWFVGFAEEREGSKRLAISVVVAHEKYIGIRASQYARMAFRHYFGNYFEEQATASGKPRRSS